MTDAAHHPKGPLDGVRVLDLSRVLAGPWATQILADLGAEVIKVERPGAGDDTRAWGPPFLLDQEGERADAAYFSCANRNKRSVAVDFSRPEGAAIVRDLAAQCDVLVENFRVGALARRGLDYESLARINPRLVYASITGFGQDGPYAARAGYDYMIQAMGGLMSVTGQPDGAPGAEPMKVGVAVADLFTGLYAANGVLAALLHARATGRGQRLDLALFDVQAAMLANQAANYFATGAPPDRLGNAHPNLAPYQPFATADGSLVVAVGNDGQFEALCRAIGDQALSRDERFTTNAGRVENRLDLAARLAPAFRVAPTRLWIERLEAAGVPCGPINRVDQVFDDPQARARGLVVEQDRADLAAPVRTVASPLRLSETPVAYRRPPPALGDATVEILNGLGLSEDAILQLEREGVVART